MTIVFLYVMFCDSGSMYLDMMCRYHFARPEYSPKTVIHSAADVGPSKTMQTHIDYLDEELIVNVLGAHFFFFPARLHFYGVL